MNILNSVVIQSILYAITIHQHPTIQPPQHYQSIVTKKLSRSQYHCDTGGKQLIERHQNIKLKGHLRLKKPPYRQNVDGSHQVIEPIDITTNVTLFCFPTLISSLVWSKQWNTKFSLLKNERAVVCLLWFNLTKHLIGLIMLDFYWLDTERL